MFELAIWRFVWTRREQVSTSSFFFWSKWLWASRGNLPAAASLGLLKIRQNPSVRTLFGPQFGEKMKQEGSWSDYINGYYWSNDINLGPCIGASIHCFWACTCQRLHKRTNEYSVAHPPARARPAPPASACPARPSAPPRFCLDPLTWSVLMNIIEHYWTLEHHEEHLQDEHRQHDRLT